MYTVSQKSVTTLSYNFDILEIDFDNFWQM